MDTYLHLAWHYALVEDTPKDDLLLAVPNIPSTSAVQVAAYCRRIARANSAGVPYGFGQPCGAFDANTCLYVGTPKRLGLTCATFVLAVFETVGMPLVEYSSWPIRPEDDAWRKYILSALSRRAAADHIEAQETDGMAVRYRPCEVAAASIDEQLPTPVSYAAVSSRAPQIASMLEAGKSD